MQLLEKGVKIEAGSLVELKAEIRFLKFKSGVIPKMLSDARREIKAVSSR